VTLAGVALSLAPALVGFGGWPYVALVLVADAVFVAAILQAAPGRAQRLSKAAMAVALVAFAVGGLV
jgi:4-hydroxybenzoate polyprenyltransferase